MSKNENISKNSNITYEQRIETMKENMGLKFTEEAKKIIKDCKVIKGEDAEENFNKELNDLTFEIEEIYALNYEQFKEKFPKTIELVKSVGGSVVTDSVKKGLVLQGWALKTNVDKIIENIKKNVKDEKKQEEAIKLRTEVMNEIATMKDKYDIEWCQDLFWKCWKIKEGEARWDYLVKQKGEKLATKRINTIKEIGGIEFCKVLQDEVYD